MYALNASTGQQVWATQVESPLSQAGIDAAFVVYKGMLFSGTSNGDSGGPCLAATRSTRRPVEVLWYFNTIPSNPKDPGWNTWPSHRAYFGGGGVWDPPTVDPATGDVYFGIGNPVPVGRLGRR